MGRDAIIEASVRAAASQLASLGPSRLTVRSVAEEADVNHALVHRHLGTKADLVAAALEHLAGRCEVEVRGGLETGATPAELTTFPAVRDYVHALASTLADAPELAHQSDYPVLRYVSTLGTSAGLDDRTARSRAVVLLAMSFGMVFFGPSLADAAELGDYERELLIELLGEALGVLFVEPHAG